MIGLIKKKFLKELKAIIVKKSTVHISYRVGNNVIPAHISRYIKRFLYQMKARQKRNLGE
jgi:hypothetical protein